MKSYHNSNKEQGATLQRSEAKAKTQEDYVLAYFRLLSTSSHEENKGATASEVQTIYCYMEWPLTSVHRAITNLTKAGHLTKTDEQREGLYGKLTYVYKLTELKDLVLTDLTLF